MNHADPESPISLIRGGTFYWVQKKARLIQPNRWNLSIRLPFVIVIAWLPMLILVATHGSSGAGNDLYAFLTDYRVYARVFLAIPLLLIGQITMESQFREMCQHFLDANLVRVNDLLLFQKILQKAVRLRDSKLPEILILVAVYLEIAYLLGAGRLRNASWAIDSVSGLFTPAGYYSLLVSHALFLGLLALAIWKWIIWIVVLWDLSRLNLQLDATDGDLTAGLGFLGEVPKAFVPVVLAVSAVIGGNWRYQILSDNVSLLSFKFPAGVLAVLVLAIFLLPLLLFTPKLLREKKEGGRKYGSLRHLHSLQFRSKWVDERNDHVESLLGTSDVSSLADISASFKNVEEMSIFPFQKSGAIALLAGLVIPMIPAMTAQIPLREILKTLLDALH